MPLFEMEHTARGRRRVFARAQLPFALGFAFLLGMVALARPESTAAPVVIAGALTTAIATLAAFVVPWERVASSWMILVAATDLAAVALLRAELLPYVPAVSVLAIFPVLWLAYGFPWYGMLIAVFGAGLITSFRFYYVGMWPQTPLEWTNVVMLPSFMVGVAVIVHVAARHLRRKSQSLAAAYRDQADALRAAQDAEAVARGIIGTVDAGVAFYDAAARLAVANPRAHAFAERGGFRLDEPPFAGVDVLATDRISPIAPHRQVIPRALSGDAVSDHLEWWGPADRQVAVLASASRVRRPEGETLGTVVVLYDVTELAESIEVREQFLRTVSHELRTPLTSITGFLDLLDEAIDPADTTLRRYVEVVTRRADDLARRVSDLFAASEGEKTLRLGMHDIGDIATAAAREVDAFARTHAHTVEVLDAGSIVVGVDRVQLGLALVELLTNAVKFGTPTSPITVSYALRAGRLRLAVSGNGPGITDAERRRVFDRFYRTPLARSREIQGFGLGLFTVRAIAIAHGGAVHIDSVPDRRTTVTIDIPVGTGGALVRASDSPSPAAPGEG